MNVTEVVMDPTLIPFDDTYILYNPSDPISYVLVYFSLLPIGILIFYFSWFVSSRELEAVVIAGGQVVNELLNNVLKNIIKEPRPVVLSSEFQANSIRSEYGMPSAHSQFMGFFLIYWSLTLVLKWEGIGKIRKFFTVAIMSAVAAMVAFSRVYLGYHSLAQVSVGLALGGLLGSGYYLAVAIVRYMGLLRWLLGWRLCQRLWVKDSFNCCPFNLRDELNAWTLRCVSSKSRSKLSIKKAS
ncbi:LADA_0C10704g1_1 [Lachancea dasiensis]|uniref:LADA_0C10704g1_1 n=1 Tax=Lachancea dasiensis TaxID=1072105 RepID=A0A1G4J1B2_9SACH|nr:LADA_0C10704g1_1 [Lachancea dasiensis]